MEKRKLAWLYCYIDAPEDEHGALKAQRQQLMDYAKQLSVEVVGSSSDMGEKPLFERSGFQHFIEAVKGSGVDVLIIANQQCLSRSTMQLAQFQALAKGYGIETCSPAEGQMG